MRLWADCKDERCIDCFKCSLYTYPSLCPEIEKEDRGNYELSYLVWRACWGCEHALWDNSSCPKWQEE